MGSVNKLTITASSITSIKLYKQKLKYSVCVSVFTASQDNTTYNHKTYKVSGFDLCNFKATTALDNNKKIKHITTTASVLQLKHKVELLIDSNNQAYNYSNVFFK